jgi:UDP-N-acetylglucosamine--N-acetylmuramyl-(pentapeptide) pyrophosphoryl-undecaprenol N-acetylglucosamine transferase
MFMSEPRIIVLAGGGTGGHVYPALAMGEALEKQGHTIKYMGDAGRLEGRVVPERGIPFFPIPAVQYPRGGVAGKISFALGLLKAILRSRRILKQIDAQMVLGVGGYISAPPILAAWTLGIPRAIHEANVTPGLANRLCARVADLVLLTYAETGDKLPGRAPRAVVGCPVNPRVLTGDREEAAKRYGLDPNTPTLLVVGGSLGAATINDIASACARDDARSYQLIQVTGPRYHAAIAAELSPVPDGVVLVDYEDRMQDAYALADLVVCRAGSSTLAELTAIGKPSVLVPSPNVTDNHQEGNARGLEALGAAIVVVESDLELASTVADIAALMADPKRLQTMAAAAKSQGHLDTAEEAAVLIGQVGR